MNLESHIEHEILKICEHIIITTCILNSVHINVNMYKI